MIRGQVRWYTFRAADKRRRVLLLTRTSAITFLTNVTIAPLTKGIRDIPTEALLTPDEDDVLSMCAVNLDNIQTVPQDNIGALITTLSPQRMEEVEQAIAICIRARSIPLNECQTPPR